MPTPKRYRRLLVAVVLLTLATTAAVGVAWRFGNELLRLTEDDSASRSIGTTANGSLKHGKRLPTSGDSFVTYSYLGSTIGRTAVHAQVRDTLLDAWGQLAESHPDIVWVYGETGWPSGGNFWPHKTHQSGLSVDLMVPVLTHDGRPTTLPCRAWNQLCYELHADRSGRFSNGLDTDFAALADLLAAIVATAPKYGLGIRRIIYAPNLQPHLSKTEVGRRLVARTPFSKAPSWVRHDNHVHIDFVVRRD